MFCVIIIFVGIVLCYFLLNKSTIYATKFEFKYEKLQLEINNTYTLQKTEFVVEPQNCAENFWITTTENTIISIDSVKCEITTNAVGTCEIAAHIKSGKNSTLTTTIIVEVIDSNANTINYVFSKSISYNLSDSYSIITLATYFNEPVLTYAISGDDPTIATLELDTDRLYINFNHTGSAVVTLESYTQRVIFNITIN